MVLLSVYICYQTVHFVSSFCRYPLNIIYFYFYYILSLLVLFAQFFVATYIFKKKGGSKRSKGAVSKEE